MGLTGWIKDQAEQAPTAMFGPFILRKDSVQHTREGTHDLAGVTAAVESGEELSRRVTATRVVLTGVFALALKKKTGGTSFLTVEGPGFAWVEEVDRKKRERAVQFAAAVRAAASAAPDVQPVEATPAAPPPPAVPAGWYPADGVQRYWDGSAWTEHTAPLA